MNAIKYKYINKKYVLRYFTRRVQCYNHKLTKENFYFNLF